MKKSILEGQPKVYLVHMQTNSRHIIYPGSQVLACISYWGYRGYHSVLRRHLLASSTLDVHADAMLTLAAQPVIPSGIKQGPGGNSFSWSLEAVLSQHENFCLCIRWIFKCALITSDLVYIEHIETSPFGGPYGSTDLVTKVTAINEARIHPTGFLTLAVGPWWFVLGL